MRDAIRREGSSNSGRSATLMSKWKGWKQLEQAVVGADGVLTVSGADLRDLYGAQLAGVQVQAAIEGTLIEHGLRMDLLGARWGGGSLVRLYKEGTPAELIIDAVNEPGEANDQIIREWANGAAGKL